jgi:hypothetical protein
MLFSPGSDLLPHFDQQDERIFIEVRTDRKPRENKSLIRGKRGGVRSAVDAGFPYVLHRSYNKSVSSQQCPVSSGTARHRNNLRDFGFAPSSLFRIWDPCGSNMARRVSASGAMTPKAFSRSRPLEAFLVWTDGHPCHPSLDRPPGIIVDRCLTVGVDVSIFLYRYYSQIGAWP